MKKLIVFCLLLLIFACSKKENCLSSVENKIQPPFDPGTFDLTTAKESSGYKECLIKIFGDEKLNSPLAFDPKYKAIQDYHQEDVDLTLSKINPIKQYLFIVNQTDHYTFYCLHLETEKEMEGNHYELLFTLDSSGKLINQILAHATGIMYIRDVIVSSSTSFNLDESTGREENVGPYYKADFKVDNDGKFVVDKSETGSGEQSSDASSDGEREEGGQSLFHVTSTEQAADELKKQIFTEDVSEEEFLEQIFFDKQGFLSIGLSGVADFVVIAFYPSDAKNEDESVNYISASRLIHAPANSSGHETAGAEVKKLASQKISDKEHLITITASYTSILEGGKNQETEKVIQLLLSEEKGLVLK